MVMGIVAAILVAVVVIFVFSRLTGLFWSKTDQNKETEVVTSEEPTESINVSLADDQTYMPNVLGLPKDMAEAKLKEYNLVMSVEAEDYSDNYKPDQVMRQDVAEGEVVEKWSTVGVTISKGSDKVDLTSLGLEQLSGEDACYSNKAQSGRFHRPFRFQGIHRLNRRNIFPCLPLPQAFYCPSSPQEPLRTPPRKAAAI